MWARSRCHALVSLHYTFFYHNVLKCNMSKDQKNGLDLNTVITPTVTLKPLLFTLISVSVLWGVWSPTSWCYGFKPRLLFESLGALSHQTTSLKQMTWLSLCWSHASASHQRSAHVLMSRSVNLLRLLLLFRAQSHYCGPGQCRQDHNSLPVVSIQTQHSLSFFPCHHSLSSICRHDKWNTLWLLTVLPVSLTSPIFLSRVL